MRRKLEIFSALAICVALCQLTACADPVQAAQEPVRQPPDLQQVQQVNGAKVELHTATVDRKLTIRCRPRTSADGVGPEWVDACNELAQLEIEEAARIGVIAPSEGPAFGDAATFIRQIPEGASVVGRMLVREIDLLGFET